jgi:hypothetical protein
MIKLQVYLFVLITQRMQNLQFVWMKIQVAMQDVPYTPVRHAYECAYVWFTSDYGRWTPTFRQCSRACKLRTVDQEALYTWKSLLHANALPSNWLQFGMPVRRKLSPYRHTKQSLTQTNHTRGCINTIQSPDGECYDTQNMQKREINKYMKKCVKLVITKN